MRHNYLLYLIIVGAILFRNSFISLTNNLINNLFVKTNNLEIKLIQDKNDYLVNEYNNLLDFKNNIEIDYNYTITNIIKNSYGFSDLLINGSDYKVGDEVVNSEGLVGIVSKINYKSSEVKYLYNTSIVVLINNETGKITSQDKDGNLIVKEISNYNHIKLNDLVYSVHGTYIGKIIKVEYDTLDNYLTIKPVFLDNLSYVAVISR